MTEGQEEPVESRPSEVEDPWPTRRHSLGAIQAGHVAQQTGLGGIGFEPIGIPRSSTTAGTGTDFVDIAQNGGPVGDYGSDLDTEQPFSPAHAAGGTGAPPHPGHVATVGDPAADAALRGEAALEACGAEAGMLAAYHLPAVQAQDLGVTPTQTSLIDRFGIRSGRVLGVANDPIRLAGVTEAELKADPGDVTFHA